MRFDATVSFSFDADTEEEALEMAKLTAEALNGLHHSVPDLWIREVVVDEVRIAETGEVPQVDNPN